MPARFHHGKLLSSMTLLQSCGKLGNVSLSQAVREYSETFKILAGNR